MSFKSGQGILGRITFRDGVVPAYDRTYLIVSVGANYIEVINVSSVRGKERKLAFRTNERLRTHWPPFKEDSFVKLDSLTRVSSSQWGGLRILCNGQTLDSSELSRIQAKIIR